MRKHGCIFGFSHMHNMALHLHSVWRIGFGLENQLMSLFYDTHTTSRPGYGRETENESESFLVGLGLDGCVGGPLDPCTHYVHI